MLHQPVSVSISTYNQPDSLKLVILAILRQSIQPDELIITDDGSSSATLTMLKEIGYMVPYRFIHVWQPDEGFRLARARNNSLAIARNDQWASLDQDTLPHSNWLENHIKDLRPGYISIGQVMNLKEEFRSDLSVESVKSGTYEKWHADIEYKRLEKLQRKYLFYTFVRRIGCSIDGRPALAVGNAALCRQDIIKINGFDEEYIGWGQEDDDLGWRLYSSGVKPLPKVNQCRISHIPHPVRHGDWRNGSNIERYRRKRISFLCNKGLKQHPHSDVVVTVINS